jgi:hypothetical protein
MPLRIALLSNEEMARLTWRDSVFRPPLPSLKKQGGYSMQAGTVIMDFSEWGDLLPAGYLVTRTRGCFHLSDWEDTPRCAGPELYYQQDLAWQAKQRPKSSQGDPS